MENLLWYLLMVFITKSVAGLDCYYTHYPAIKSCTNLGKNEDHNGEFSKDEEQKILEDRFKCASAIQSEVMKNCYAHDPNAKCYTMTGKYKDKKFVFYGCSNVETLCNSYASDVKKIFGEEAPEGSCAHCSTDLCNMNRQNKVLPITPITKSMEPTTLTSLEPSTLTSLEPSTSRPSEQIKTKNSATWIVPKITMIFLNIVFHIIL